MYSNRRTETPRGALVQKRRIMSTMDCNIRVLLPLHKLPSQTCLLLLNLQLLWPTATSSLMVDLVDLTFFTTKYLKGVQWPGTRMSIRLWTFLPLIITLAPYNTKGKSSGNLHIFQLHGWRHPLSVSTSEIQEIHRLLREKGELSKVCFTSETKKKFLWNFIATLFEYVQYLTHVTITMRTICYCFVKRSKDGSNGYDKFKARYSIFEF